MRWIITFTGPSDSHITLTEGPTIVEALMHFLDTIDFDASTFTHMTMEQTNAKARNTPPASRPHLAP